MPRTLLLCALILAVGPALPADVPPKKDDAPTRTAIALTVSAMAEPRPALRYTLLPELKDMNPGNPIQGYLKCFMEQQNFFHHKTSVDNREKWQVMPLKELPLKELEGYGGSALRNADYAARLETPDWQVLLELKRQGIELLLPEVQQMRSLAGALKVRFRAEIAGGRFDAAIKTAQTMLALARHLGEHPTIIAELVGIAIAFIATGPLEEMVQQPGCPNLYWALTDLPTPFVDLRKGMQGERTFFAKEFAAFDGQTPLDEARIQQILKRLDYLLAYEATDPTHKISVTIANRARDAAAIAAARMRIVAAGLAENKAKALPAIQVLLLDAQHAYEVGRDDELKWVNTPWPRVDAALYERGKGDALLARRKGDGLFNILLPSTHKAMRARVRLEQRFALLRHVEAIRLYAAANGGRLPASLGAIDVPLPLDPVTGKAFSYHVEGKKAIVHGTPPLGMEKIVGFNVEYHVTIR